MRFGDARSLANGDPLLDGAVLALHVATPVKLAAAPLGASLPDDVVPSPAAERRATVARLAGLVAPATGRPWYVNGQVPLAEVGRFLVVEELLGQVPRLLVLPVQRLVVVVVAMLPLSLAIQRATPSIRAITRLRRHVAQITLRHKDCTPEAVLESFAH